MGLEKWKGRLRGAPDPVFSSDSSTGIFIPQRGDFQAPIEPFQHVGSVVARIINRAASVSGRPLPFPEAAL